MVNQVEKAPISNPLGPLLNTIEQPSSALTPLTGHVIFQPTKFVYCTISIDYIPHTVKKS